MNANQIKISADEFARYKKLGAEKSAIEREQKNIVAGWEGLLPDKVETNVGVPFVIVNGNGDEIGKVTVYACEAKTIPAFVARRIS
jgi:hypothetical protein